jgi:hypothetical protein
LSARGKYLIAWGSSFKSFLQMKLSGSDVTRMSNSGTLCTNGMSGMVLISETCRVK